jgi:hypothetical protein
MKVLTCVSYLGVFEIVVVVAFVSVSTIATCTPRYKISVHKPGSNLLAESYRVAFWEILLK